MILKNLIIFKQEDENGDAEDGDDDDDGDDGDHEDDDDDYDAHPRWRQAAPLEQV